MHINALSYVRIYKRFIIRRSQGKEGKNHKIVKRCGIIEGEKVEKALKRVAELMQGSIALTIKRY